MTNYIFNHLNHRSYIMAAYIQQDILNDRARPAADVACILDEAGIPNFLWGRQALCLVGEIVEAKVSV